MIREAQLRPPDTPSLGEILQLQLAPGQYEIAISSADVNYGDIGQYFISGTVAPEPASSGFLACGGLFLVRRRARRQFTDPQAGFLPIVFIESTGIAVRLQSITLSPRSTGRHTPPPAERGRPTFWWSRNVSCQRSRASASR